MPSNYTSNNIDFVQPTKYNIQLNRVAKKPPLEEAFASAKDAF